MTTNIIEWIIEKTSLSGTLICACTKLSTWHDTHRWFLQIDTTSRNYLDKIRFTEIFSLIFYWNYSIFVLLSCGQSIWIWLHDALHLFLCISLNHFLPPVHNIRIFCLTLMILSSAQPIRLPIFAAHLIPSFCSYWFSFPTFDSLPPSPTYLL